MPQPFFTVGHGTRSIEDFTALLNEAQIAHLADVRTVPRSRTNPQFNADLLPISLAHHDISHEHVAALGGLRSRQRAIHPSTNAFWDNQSFHNYADYAMSEPFGEALRRLRQLGRERRCAIMCAETVWWRCHRRIIADHLIAAGEQVFHILGPDHIEAARLTSAAKVGPDSTVTYPAAV